MIIEIVEYDLKYAFAMLDLGTGYKNYHLLPVYFYNYEQFWFKSLKINKSTVGS